MERKSFFLSFFCLGLTHEMDWQWHLAAKGLEQSFHAGLAKRSHRAGKDKKGKETLALKLKSDGVMW